VTQAGELLQQQRAIFAALSKTLIEDAGLSLRKTASFLGTTHQRVQEVMRVELK
jgi:predicted XRE-type DNA-binding protein